MAAEAFAVLYDDGAGKIVATDTNLLWISPSPVTVKQRIFCLPYAGGVSENIYARYAFFTVINYFI